MLGTNSALLTGHLNPARMERSVGFKMDQVQAHVVCSETDPQRGPLWLQISNGKLTTPPGAEGAMRQVLLPFKVRADVGDRKAARGAGQWDVGVHCSAVLCWQGLFQLILCGRHLDTQCQLMTTKQAQTAAAALAAAGGPGSGPNAASSRAQLQQLSIQQQPPPQQQQQQQGARGSSTGGVQGGSGNAGNAAQELRLHVPTIGARLDSRQFEVLVDVIQNIAMAPLPMVSDNESAGAQAGEGGSCRCACPAPRTHWSSQSEPTTACRCSSRPLCAAWRSTLTV